MSLYDDDLDAKQRADKVDGWSSGIKLLQSQLLAKKAAKPAPAALIAKKLPTFLPPVIDLKNKKDAEQPDEPLCRTTKKSEEMDEYDPMWPNEYEKLVKEKREKAKERDDKRRDSSGLGKRRRKSDEFSPKFSGFSGRPDDDEEPPSKTPLHATSNRQSIGAAIAPPPSLQESSNNNNPNESKAQIPGITGNYGKGGVAAKIMAKYGFRDGQGLGKQEQGMAMALQVEKTSKRGGRIIHEKEIIIPTLFPPPSSPPPAQDKNTTEPSITEIMKSPSKVVLLRNMVGPGDVDEELEPEVKDECNTKYGDVVKVIINEIPLVCPEESVRIFVEFKRIESAIKAVVDLNGRFFGGRQVRAGFYNFDKFQNLQLG